MRTSLGFGRDTCLPGAFDLPLKPERLYRGGTSVPSMSRGLKMQGFKKQKRPLDSKQTHLNTHFVMISQVIYRGGLVPPETRTRHEEVTEAFGPQPCLHGSGIPRYYNGDDGGTLRAACISTCQRLRLTRKERPTERWGLRRSERLRQRDRFSYPVTASTHGLQHSFTPSRRTHHGTGKNIQYHPRKALAGFSFVRA